MKLRDNKILFNLYQVYKYILFFPILGFATAFLVTLNVLLGFIFGQRVGRWIGVTWAKINSYMTPMFVKTFGFEKIDKKQSYVVVSNHQSQFDIFVIYGWLPVDFKWVMKIQLRKVPFLGYFCYKMGHIFVDRSNSEAARASINAAKKTITGGTSIVFFPEGHRSNDGKLLPFKKGAFKLALDMGLPILPVTIVDTMYVLPNKTIDLFPGKAKLFVHDPIPIEKYNDGNVEELLDKTREVIQNCLHEHEIKN